MGRWFVNKFIFLLTVFICQVTYAEDFSYLQGAWRGGFMNPRNHITFTLDFKSDGSLEYYEYSNLNLHCASQNIQVDQNKIYVELMCNKVVINTTRTLVLRIYEPERLKADGVVQLKVNSNMLGTETIYVQKVPDLKFGDVDSYKNKRSFVFMPKGEQVYNDVQVDFFADGSMDAVYGLIEDQGLIYEFGTREEWKEKGDHFADGSEVKVPGWYRAPNVGSYKLENNILTLVVEDDHGETLNLVADLSQISDQNIFLASRGPEGTPQPQVPMYINHRPNDRAGTFATIGDLGFPQRP